MEYQQQTGYPRKIRLVMVKKDESTWRLVVVTVFGRIDACWGKAQFGGALEAKVGATTTTA